MPQSPELHSRNVANRGQRTAATSSYGGCSQLRLEIKSLAISEGSHAPRERQFYPSHKLRSVITKEKVLEVLNCPCSACKRRVEFQQTSDKHKLCDDIFNTRPISCFNYNDVLHVFALLTCVECPQLIAPFLRIHQLDRLPDTLDKLSVDFLRQHVWPQFDRRHPIDSRSLAEEFYWQRHKFSVGSVTNDYQEFDRNTILPFVNEQPLAEGGFGRVYSFEIADGYREHLRPGHVRRFARKELRNPVPGRFNAERINLELIRKLADPHLISIIKAYKHGDHFNFIFPCARTNLEDYLRKSQLRSPVMYSRRIQLHWFWIQMLGLAGAVRKIHSFSIPGQQEGSELYGYHFDIKPANILVMDTGLFVVTDFGQANFKRKERGTSRVTGMGGTEAYAPPEFEERDPRPNRKYDVWSLGCVFLEICTFIVLGYDGINKLDSLKVSKSSDGHIEFESFYEHDDKPNSYRLKRVISKWIEELPGSASICDEEGRKFFREVLTVVTTMLEVEVSNRMTSEQVYSQLREIMQPYLLTASPSVSQDTGDITLPPDELDLGAGSPQTIRDVLCITKDARFTGPIRMSENKQGEVSVFNVSNSQLECCKLGKRADLFLIPQYAFPHEKRHAYSGSHIVLEHAKDDRTSGTPSLQLIFRDIRTATTVQSMILGQEVHRNLYLNGIEISTVPQLLPKILGRKPKNTTENLGGGHVQLWLAKSSKLTNYTAAQDTPRSGKLSSRISQLMVNGPQKRRIVIITSTTIYTIFFSKAMRLKPRVPEESESPLVLHIVPTDPMAVPSLTVSRFIRTAGAGETAPAIPTDRATFERQEMMSSFQCQSVALTFQCRTDADLFWDTYQSMKEAWKAEDTSIEVARRAMGPTLGYAS